MKRIANILYQFNNKYAVYAGVSITSLLENNRHLKIYIHILEDTEEPLSEKNKKRLILLEKQYDCKIIFYDTAPLISMMKESGIPQYRGSYSANLKLFACRLLRSIKDRYIYIDSDTIINDRIDGLLDIDLRDKALAMVYDSIGRSHRFDIGFGENDEYFNSGVILVNVPIWKKDKIEENILFHVNNVRAHYPSPDQDLLNVVCKEKIARLDLIYNFQPIHLITDTEIYFKYFEKRNYYSAVEIEEARRKPVIYHCYRFLGEFPWHKNNLHPCNQLFDSYLEKSNWHNFEKEPADSSLMIRVEKLLFEILPRKYFVLIFAKVHKWFFTFASIQSLKNKNNRNM